MDAHASRPGDDLRLHGRMDELASTKSQLSRTRGHRATTSIWPHQCSPRQRTVVRGGRYQIQRSWRGIAQRVPAVICGTRPVPSSTPPLRSVHRMAYRKLRQASSSSFGPRRANGAVKGAEYAARPFSRAAYSREKIWLYTLQFRRPRQGRCTEQARHCVSESDLWNLIQTRFPRRRVGCWFQPGVDGHPAVSLRGPRATLVSRCQSDPSGS